jgi:hypothetical protein
LKRNSRRIRQVFQNFAVRVIQGAQAPESGPMHGENGFYDQGGGILGNGDQ